MVRHDSVPRCRYTCIGCQIMLLQRDIEALRDQKEEVRIQIEELRIHENKVLDPCPRSAWGSPGDIASVCAGSGGL